jgi:hypothetical protein
MSYNASGVAFGAPAGQPASVEGPLVVVFERDDTLAVPLLSQLRLAGYDVRGARTPVELFDTAQKHTVALMLIDLGNAAAGRREFWVALDAQRRGRAIQVVTYRFMGAGAIPDSELDVSARALADIEIRGPQDLQALVDTVRQRVPLQGGAPLGRGAPSSPGSFDGPGGGAFGSDPGAFGASGYTSGVFASSGHTPNGHSMYGLGSPVLGTDPFTAPNPSQAPPAPSFMPFGPPSQGAFAPAASSSQNPLPYGQQPESPFAHPADVNPFSGQGSGQGGSPFAQPFSGNPFAAPAPGQTPPTQLPNPSMLQSYAGPEPVLGAGFGLEPPRGPGGEAHQGGNGRGGAVADAWVPPPTGKLNSRGLNGFNGNGHGALPALADLRSQAASASVYRGERLARSARDTSERGFPTYDTALQNEALANDDPALHDATAPISVRLPAMPPALHGQGERTLGTVLVEGALLSPRKLEVLKGIQNMLAGVDMDFKLGELALLFKFLSPDQLLAALLVSRGVVSPQQIAALGRIKQELGGSGMDYDLETLLVMFHILPAEELRQLRRELA